MNARPDRDSFDMLFSRMPEGWSAWDAQRLHEFKAVIGELHRAETLPKVIECARRAAPFYGIDPSTFGDGGR